MPPGRRSILTPFHRHEPLLRRHGLNYLDGVEGKLGERVAATEDEQRRGDQDERPIRRLDFAAALFDALLDLGPRLTVW